MKGHVGDTEYIKGNNLYTFYFFILTYFVSPVNISEFIIESPNLLILSTLICLLKVKFCFAHKINAILIK